MKRNTLPLIGILLFLLVFGLALIKGTGVPPVALAEGVMPQSQRDEEIAYHTRRLAERKEEWHKQASLFRTHCTDYGTGALSIMNRQVELANLARDTIRTLESDIAASSLNLGPEYSIYVTSYNPEVGQTDASPCIGASLRDVCVAAKEGDRVIALSQDMMNMGVFAYHDKVLLQSDNPKCRGVFSLEDTMNARWTKRGDLFFMDREDNTSCNATVARVIRN